MNAIRWSRPAQAARIDEYCRGLAPDDATRLGRAALDAACRLADRPGLGAPMIATVRKWRVRGTPYLLLYRADADGVTILRVRHGAEDWLAEP